MSYSPDILIRTNDDGTFSLKVPLSTHKRAWSFWVVDQSTGNVKTFNTWEELMETMLYYILENGNSAQ